MARVLVNDVEQSDSASVEAWGGLLEALDSRLTANGHIVTAVRFDGIDEPAFRDPAVVGRSLKEVAVVQVEAGTANDLVTRCVGEVLGALTSLRTDTIRVGEAFRRYDIAVANPALSNLATGLRTLLAIVQAIGLGLRLDLGEMAPSGNSPTEMVSELTGYIESIIAAQGAEDWLGVADVMEYDLEPSLQRWSAMLEDLGALAQPGELKAAS